MILSKKIGLLGCIASAVLIAQQKKTMRPNIIIILADDMGWGDPSCYNKDSKNPTPNIDRLASGGMRFINAHSPSSVSSPTRYGLLTGRYAWRTPLWKFVLTPYDCSLIEKGRTTIPSMLKEKGYQTGFVGKWHLGWNWPIKEGYPKDWELWKYKKGQPDGLDLSKPLTGGPFDAGFDYQFGVDVPNFPPYCFFENGKVIGEQKWIIKPDTVHGWAGIMQEGWELQNILPGLGKKAVAYIDKHAKEETPFFLYFALTSPHTPIVPVKEYLGKSQSGPCGDFIMQTDAIVGDIYAALEKNNIRKNTIIIFTSDNGAAAIAGDDFLDGKEYGRIGSQISMFQHNPSGPWKGLKGDAWEGGHRVPFIVSWPGKVKPNTINENLFCLTDIIATLSSFLKIDLSENSAEDSFDQSEIWKNPKAKTKRNVVVHHTMDGTFAITKDNWRLVIGKGGGGAFSEAFYPDLQKCEFTGQLYDLKNDPQEKNNLYNTNPEKVKELTDLLNSYKEKGYSNR